VSAIVTSKVVDRHSRHGTNVGPIRLFAIGAVKADGFLGGRNSGTRYGLPYDVVDVMMARLSAALRL
jgi:hypothetical protein